MWSRTYAYMYTRNKHERLSGGGGRCFRHQKRGASVSAPCDPQPVDGERYVCGSCAGLGKRLCSRHRDRSCYFFIDIFVGKSLISFILQRSFHVRERDFGSIASHLFRFLLSGAPSSPLPLFLLFALPRLLGSSLGLSPPSPHKEQPSTRYIESNRIESTSTSSREQRRRCASCNAYSASLKESALRIYAHRTHTEHKTTTK